MVFVSVAVAAAGLFSALMGSELADDAMRFKRVCVPIDHPSPTAVPDSFAVAAEQRFGITDLACADKTGAPPHECSFDDPDPPQCAEWIRDGKAYHGRIVAHGTRVTLAPYSKEVG